MSEQDDMSLRQNDYALFLPAISSFYAAYIGKQQVMNYVDPARIPFANGMEALNFFNKQDGLFYYPWALYSAGHANIDKTKDDPKEYMIRKRDPNTFLIGDSGGFQIAKGKWPADWRAGSGDPAAEKKRKMVLEWLDEYTDYGMVLDIPAWVIFDEKASEASCMKTHKDCVDATKYNNEYFIKNRKGVKNGGTRFLNVLQGSSHTESDDWYNQMKVFNDPNVYPDKHFDGWAMGGLNGSEIHLVLKRIVTMYHDGLLQEGLHDWIHFLGTSRLEWAVMLTAIQRAIRKYYNPSLTVSFDCASPFLATANGLIYTTTITDDNKRWSYRTESSLDDKNYATDTRQYTAAVRQDGVYPKFDGSPVIDNCKVNDICYYKPGDLNKIGKEGKTSWDSFSYALQMGHNVWMHIEAVQRANREYDAGKLPTMLTRIEYDYVRFEKVVDDIFSQPTLEKSIELIEKYDRFWMQIVGLRGTTGKRSRSSTTAFNMFFTPANKNSDSSNDDREEDTMDPAEAYAQETSCVNDENLNQLEETIDAQENK